MPPSENTANLNNKQGEGGKYRRLLTSYQYPGYPPADLTIQSSREQPYLSFDRDTNRFGHATNAGGEAEASPPRIIVYLIPGNPGLVEFYDQFIAHLLDCTSSAWTQQQQLAGCEVVCAGHLGHSLRHNSNLDFRFLENFKLWNQFPHPRAVGSASLSDQLDYHSQLIANIIHHGIPNPAKTKLIIIGHSVGAYIATKLLERYPTRIAHMIGLFPTISQIGRSPNGRRLRPLFSPIVLPFLNIVQMMFSLIIPKLVICRLIKLVYDPISGGGTRAKLPSSPPTESDKMRVQKKTQQTDALMEHNLLIMLTFILNINALSAVLKMARSEMQSIRDLDVHFIRRFKNQLTLLWTSPGADEWVGEPEIAEIIRTLNLPAPPESPHVPQPLFVEPAAAASDPPVPSEHLSINCQSSVRPAEDAAVPTWKRMEEGVPHAFCLKDNEVMARECSALIEKVLSKSNA